MIHVGVLKVEMHIGESLSLKDKRRVVKRLKDRVKNNFNVSIAEVDNLDKWQLATLGVSCVSNDKKHVDGTLNRIRDFFEKEKDIVINDCQMEMI